MIDTFPNNLGFEGLNERPDPGVLRILLSHYTKLPLDVVITDNITGFSFSSKLDDHIPSLMHRGTGIFSNVEILKDSNVSGVHQLPLLIASDAEEIGIRRNLRLWLQSLGYYMHGIDNLLIPLSDPVNGINSRRTISIFEEEASNCYLRVESSDTLKTRFPTNLSIQGLLLDKYPCIYRKINEDLQLGDQLILEDYGSLTDMKFGKPHYLLCERQCLQDYVVLKETGMLFCDICYELLPVPGTLSVSDELLWLMEHQEKCKPYMYDFYAPPPTYRQLKLVRR